MRYLLPEVIMPGGGIIGNNLDAFSRRHLVIVTHGCLAWGQGAVRRVCDVLAVPETLMMHPMVLVVVVAETCMQRHGLWRGCVGARCEGFGEH